MITKIDYEEAMEPVTKLRNMLLFFNALAFLWAFVVAYFAGKQFARPIEELISSTNTIKKGDLSKRAAVNAKNEIGVLVASFNEMAEQLQKKIEQMDNYAYIISHDLRAPLNSLESLAMIIREEYRVKSNFWG